MNPAPATRAPDALLIILAVLLGAVVLTWLVPSGEFERRQEGTRTVVVPGTYQAVEASPVPWHGFFTAPLKGFTDHHAALIMGFVLLIGGVFAVINATGAIPALLLWVVRTVGDNPARRRLVIPVLMIAFSIGGNTFGMAEEVLVFLMITIPLARRLGWDPIVGVAIPFVGAGVGFAGAAFNPFTVGIAQGLSGLPVFSGWGFRMVMWAVLTLVAILYVMRYAARIEQAPAASPALSGAELEEHPLTARRLGVLALFLAGLGLLIYGVTRWDWYIEEIAALFLGIGFAAAIIGGLAPNAAARAFGTGTREMVGAAILIGLSRSILIVMEQGRIVDTILHTLSGAAEGLPAVVSVQVMLAVQFCLNFLVPSGSGQAALTMPIMAPLSDLLGIPRQAAVVAYQLGDGLCNFVTPTSGILMGILGIAGISFGSWLRWIARLMLLLLVAGMIFLVIGVTVAGW
ncbi:MAG TPA: AbgT family transporter [Opitutaceae bacterium]|nr:AbgT family transporter [Opitutaceae bacterium]HRJ48266.1 AbgT family transporter [Opitutaceae bacterium]